MSIMLEPLGDVDEASCGLKLAVAQLEYADNGKELNAARACEVIEEAARLGARLVVLPEKYLTGFLEPDEMSDGTEPLDGPHLRRVRDIAKACQIGMVMGLTEFDKDSQRYFNTNIVTGPDGDMLALYHKTHPYGPRERALLTPGDSLESGLFTLDGVQCATLSAIDFEFPEAVRCIALARAQCVLVTSGNWFEYGQRSQRFTRAIENHMFLGYSMRTGASRGREFHGDSAIVDPFGRPLAIAEREEAILLATIDREVAQRSRGDVDYLSHRRPELYGRLFQNLRRLMSTRRLRANAFGQRPTRQPSRE